MRLVVGLLSPITAQKAHRQSNCSRNQMKKYPKKKISESLSKSSFDSINFCNFSKQHLPLPFTTTFFKHVFKHFILTLRNYHSDTKNKSIHQNPFLKIWRLEIFKDFQRLKHLCWFRHTNLTLWIGSRYQKLKQPCR